VVRCPECGTEIDADEEEVEEGEILTCPECEAELEVIQTHPVKLNVISEGDDDEDDEEEDGDDEDEDDEEGDEGELDHGEDEEEDYE
jgi:alpha-aminoadipate carrier protein LysW